MIPTLTIRVEELDLELSPILVRRDRERAERGDRTERVEVVDAVEEPAA